MSSNSKKEYIAVLRRRYRAASKSRKKVMLDEFCANTGLHRKHAIRLLKANAKARRPQSGRPPVYSGEVITHLRRLWILMDQMCSKNMAAALPQWISHYDCPEPIKKQLLRMSPATIDRKLRPFKAPLRRRWNSGTMVGRRFIKHLIPIKPFNFTVTAPGHLEADTVAHCGGFMAGEFAWSLTVTDVYSGWTEVRAVLGKSGVKVGAALKEIEGALPFDLRVVNVDNGSEFLNQHLVRLYGHDKFTRSRAYRKNDNCYVEQKNFTHVRQLFGYERIERQDLVHLMNGIYSAEHSLLQNFFVPQVKLRHKLRVGSRYKRIYTKPKTPYQILLDSPHVDPGMKAVLNALYLRLNPFELRKRRQAKLKAFLNAFVPSAERKTGS